MAEVIGITLGNAAGAEVSWRLDLERGSPNHDFIRDHLDRNIPYEPDVTGFLVRALRPGDTFVDVGANLGWFTCLAASAVGPTGSVIAFEPGPQNVRELSGNVRHNGFSNVQIVDKAVSDVSGPVDFFINSGNSGGNALWDPQHYPGNGPAASVERIGAVTLDDYLGAVPDRIRVLKVDTEGAEEKVLRGARSLLRLGQIDFVVAELHELGLRELGSDQMGLRGCMASVGYECFLLDSSSQYPRQVHDGVTIECRFIVNLLFCRSASLPQIWPRIVVDDKTLEN